MSESPSPIGEPPPRHRTDTTMLRVVAAGETKVSKGPRGRPSQDDYARRVCEVMRHDAFRLEECSALAQLPGVQALASRLRQSVLPTGTAIRSLLDRAAHEVETLARSQPEITAQRIATFLHIWYREGGTVVDVGYALGLSRSHVAHSVQKRACELVARRLLELAWRVEVPA